MKKKFRLTIDIVAAIPDRLTPDFIKEIITQVDREHYLPGYLPPTDKHQAVIDYIKKHEHIHEECLTGDLFFSLSDGGFNEELTALLNPEIFDHIVLENSTEFAAEIRDFINRLYNDFEADVDEKVDVDGNQITTRNSKKYTLEALKREIDTEIIQESLLNYEITAASFKVVKTEH